ncbi:MAG: hypothetical protein HOV81_12010 [Kofleriaceae bacterium]|nr:hypothetical protein [Kofleriaceae bacterium]
MPLALHTPTAKTVGPPPIRETDLDRILKLIPTEILAFYTAAVPISPQVPWKLFPFALFVTGLVLVPLVLFLDGRNTSQPASPAQYVVRILAFAAWAMAISWPFSAWSSGEDLNWVRSLAVLIVPLIGALVLRGDKLPTPSF